MDLSNWFKFFFKFAYNALYSIKFPGTNIRMIYLLILASVLNIIIVLFRRMLLTPTSKAKGYLSKAGNQNRKSSGGDD